MNIFAAGLLGEWRAERYLRAKGMSILERRYRAGRGEIDLIARDGEWLVMVEVKSRPGGKPGDGLYAIDREKKQRLRSAAACYLKTHPAPLVRFDAVEISAAGIWHLQNIL